MSRSIDGYYNFALKSPAKCLRCGCPIDTGMMAWGRKNDLTRKWDFLCDKCIRVRRAGGIDKRESTEGLGKALDALEKHIDPDENKKALEAFGFELDGVRDEPAVASVALNAIDLIMAHPAWRI